MLYRAYGPYNLCEPDEERQEEIDLLKYAFINRNFSPKKIVKPIQLYNERKRIKENKKGAKERTEVIVFLYVQEFLDNFRKIL